MRIVAVADTHLFHEDLRVPDGDVFIHAGDLCRRGNLEELAAAQQWLVSLPHRTKILVAGNHDWAFSNSPLEARRLLGSSITYLEDSGVELQGLRVWGSPWQPEYNAWAFNLPRGDALREKWGLIPQDTDVVITHGPPAGIGDGSGDEAGPRGGYGGGVRMGCEALRERMREVRPLLHLFGHIHDARGSWTIGPTVFANVTTYECELPATVFDVDVLRRTVAVVG